MFFLVSLVWRSCYFTNFLLSEPSATSGGVAADFRISRVFFCPQVGLPIIVGALPLMGFAPWTGSLTFEELDVVVLTLAASGYAWMGLNGYGRGGMLGRVTLINYCLFAFFLASCYLMALIWGMFRGFADAGGFAFGWYQGFHEPMNSVRIGKSYLLALLMVPLWLANFMQNPKQAQALLSLGLMLGLAGASAATVWERLAFTGLFDFSSDYRTTGLFWEMHVGGAALDGFLVLTLPFALRELLAARTATRWALAAAVLTLSAYACLTTFSRGVYLAVPIGISVFWVLHIRQQRQQAEAGLAKQQGGALNATVFPVVFLLLGFGLGAAVMFPSSGYRGMAALLATVALMLPLAKVVRGFHKRRWLTALAAGALLVLITLSVTWLVPKGAYMASAASVTLTLAMLALHIGSSKRLVWAAPGAVAGFFASLASTALVAHHWGDATALQHSMPVLAVVLLIGLVAGTRSRPMWPETLRWQASSVAAMGAVAVMVGVFGGGVYMGGRFLTGSQDLNSRIAHWKLGYSMLQTPEEWWLGKGLGRFPSNYFLYGDPLHRPGDYRIKRDGDNAYLTLTGGLHMNGFGEIFRVTQRISEPGKTPTVTARVRTAKDVNLHLEVCEKHLLYGQNCLGKQVLIKSMAGQWQPMQAVLEGDGASRGAWYAPRILAFSVAVETRGGMVDLDDIALTRQDGQQLLSNSSFGDDMARWFFTSDKHHMPWHIKSMYMNVQFDQGVVGATLFGLLLAGAIWRTSLGKARHHTLAPALAAGLTGLAIVGLFDSLLDVPRLAWIFYLFVLIAWMLPARVPSTQKR